MTNFHRVSLPLMSPSCLSDNSDKKTRPVVFRVGLNQDPGGTLGAAYQELKPELVVTAQTWSCTDASFAELHSSGIKTQSFLLLLVFWDWGVLSRENGVP